MFRLSQHRQYARKHKKKVDFLVNKGKKNKFNNTLDEIEAMKTAVRLIMNNHI